MGDGFDAFVLTGGKSERMGRDKALLVIEGEAMAQRVARVLRDAGAARVVCVGGDVDALRSLGLSVEIDPREGSGPLGGVLSALDLAREDMVVVAPCDLLAPSSTFVRALRGALGGDRDAAVAVPIVDGRWRPLPCALRIQARGAVADAFDGGERTLHRALGRLARVEVEVGPLADADTPEDLPDHQ